ncbi:Eco29kI family restriction endonuclease [Maricaulis sp.]|uniref:Eco29kI family restriction endonuclease n=1 Tax=Maricaulis sp. TaxID=1486257 RepID=UPI003A90D3B6
MQNKFCRDEHVYTSHDFEELIMDAVRFFNGTPVHVLPPPERFSGVGVYALYFIGAKGRYAKYGALNRLQYEFPIYVGKAVPKGWRQSRADASNLRIGHELFSRLREHSRNIDLGEGLASADFRCRFMIFEGAGSDMISSIEASLIKSFKPLWNSVVDGFGNHTPGAGRFNQAKSDWDVIHPGRLWAEKCLGKARERAEVEARIATHLLGLGE